MVMGHLYTFGELSIQVHCWSITKIVWAFCLFVCLVLGVSIHSRGEGNGNPLQYSCLESPLDGGAWWAAVHGITQSWAWLKRLSMHACIGEGNGNPLQYSCLENPRDGGAWWAAVYGVTQSQTWLKQLSSSSVHSRVSIHSMYSIHTFYTIYLSLRYTICKSFLPFCKLSFYPIDDVFRGTKVFNFHKV